MKEAYAQQLANRDYQRFLGKVPRVEGVWDDHDFGVNDVGKRLSDHPGRVAVFLDFLGVGPEDPRRGGATLYASHVFGEAPKQVRKRAARGREGGGVKNDFYGYVSSIFESLRVVGRTFRMFVGRLFLLVVRVGRGGKGG